MSRTKQGRRKRRQGKGSGGNTTGDAVQNARSGAAGASSPKVVTSLADLGQLDISTVVADKPTCRGFKIKDGKLTDIPCGMPLTRRTDIDRGYCGHHSGQAHQDIVAPDSTNQVEPKPNPIPSTNPASDTSSLVEPDQEDEPMTASVVQQDAPAELQLEELQGDERFDWKLIASLGLPEEEPSDLPLEEAQALLEPAALDQHVPLRRANFFTDFGDGKPRFIVNAKLDNLEVRGRQVVYAGIIAGDRQIKMYLDVFDRVIDLNERAKKGDQEAIESKGSAVNHKMVSPTLLQYYQHLLNAAGYPAANRGQLTWATQALLSRQFSFQGLLDEDRRMKEEKQAYKERTQQEAAAAQVAYGSRLSALLEDSTPPTPATAATNGHGAPEQDEDDELLSAMRGHVLQILEGGEHSFSALVLGLRKEFSDQVSDDLIAEVIGEFAQVYNELNISLSS